MDAPLSASFTSSTSTGDRSRRPSYTRASSRSSTGATSDSRMSAHTADRSMSNLIPSPQLPLSQPQQQTSSLSSTQSTSHIVHRFQDGANKRASPAPSTSTDSSKFRSINESTSDLKSIDSKPALTATSSYLQEKLLKERKVESERSSSRLSNDKMASTLDLRGGQSSPARAPFDISRPKSSTGHLDGSKKKSGVGLKEMEQTLTTLHKQNFDLKLELYHRREKQTALEEQCGSLETEKRELEEINDKLMSELEMRDKAVEEAVAMIVSLEARLEELLQERQMMQQAEKEQFFATDTRLRSALSSALHETTNGAAGTESVTSFDETPKPTTKADDDQRTINRMPSFVSERSELTENLRNVYLGTRAGSLVSLPRMSEDNMDVDLRDGINRIASPSLSVLSESSFLSIYGKTRDIPTQVTSAPSEPRPMSPVACVPDIPRSMPDAGLKVEDSNGTAAAVVAHALASTAPPPTSSTVTANRPASRAQTQNSSTPTKKRSSSSNRNPHLNENQNAAAFNSLTDFLGTNSPLRQLEKMEISLQAMNDASRPASQHGRAEIESLARHLREHELGKSYARQAKKDALRRVRTDAPFSRDPHNLPPTPDTISTSTLRRYKNSNDTLCLQDKDGANERSYLAMSEANTSRSSSGEKRISALESFVDSIPAMHPPSTSAFNSRRHEIGGRSTYFDSQLHIPPRPRSADETTISHHGRGSVWGDSESSDDDMDIDGNDSASLHDYWLRESLRPTGQAPAPSTSRSRRGGRVSPDLFSFPTTSNGWATTAMFGSLSGQGYQGSAPLAQTLDALGASLPTPAAGLFGSDGLLASPLPYGMNMNGISSGPPPPPHRRSSLHAHTGSTHGSRRGSLHGTAPGTPSLGTPGLANNNKHRRSPTRPGTTTGKDELSPSKEHNGQSQPPTPSAPAPATQQEQMTVPKQRHYPPTSGSNSNATRSRVMSLFRRSGSHEPSSAATAALASSATVPATATPTEPTSAPAIGMPSRVRRNELDEDHAGGPGGASATPPPILRNPRPVRGGGGEAGDKDESAVLVKEVVTPVPAPQAPEAAPTATATATPLPQEVRKKWLGRVTGLRNRAG
ncbi:hypothetical protein HMPREF1624_05771 [Sporothrix schenckii ATCC 58251]|uniref:Centrosomin N-terminal motif 1 domain-containing protein n=1 Tax=Sporothrix schenckii (strain ATCC 58251 / de Perez 2211183) TaxID=1391915 RepID=U7PT11_SPOS1|nr:hypothetical protein HMPREF1624_05771 [Sporothrix schenckii ATCC 58251]